MCTAQGSSLGGNKLVPSRTFCPRAVACGLTGNYFNEAKQNKLNFIFEILLWPHFISLSWICDPALSDRWASVLRKELRYVDHVLNFVAGWQRVICLRLLSFLFRSTNSTKYVIINVTSNGELQTSVGTRSLFRYLLIYKHSSFKICLQNYLLNPVLINLPNVSDSLFLC
jgi:hypothetical protein